MLCIIHNPYANRWRSGKRGGEIADALRDAGCDCRFMATEHPGHAVELAERAAGSGDFSAVVAAGGDGTVSEVANGLLRAAGESDPTIPFGVIPIGTGNDFATMAGLPGKPGDAARALAGGHVRAIDAIRLTLAEDGEAGPPRYFINNAAIGMEPLVTIEASKIRWVSGTPRYLLGTLQALRKLQAWDLHVEWDDGSFRDPAFMLSLCNSPRTGGMFRMAPDALLSDGLLDFVIMPKMPMTGVLAMLPKIISGRHVRDPRVISGRTRGLRVTIEPRPDFPPNSPLHADGEVLTRGTCQLSAEVQPGRLRLLSPPGGSGS